MAPSCFQETAANPSNRRCGVGGGVRFSNNGVLSDRLVEITTYSYKRNTIVEAN